MDCKERYFHNTKPLTVSRILTLDPGARDMGHAFWSVLKRGPKVKATMPDSMGTSRLPRGVSWEEAVQHQCNALEALILHHGVQNVVMEFAELWGKSARSQAAATTGNLFKLAFLVGGLYRTASDLVHASPVIVLPTEWKGQLSKTATKKRLLRALGIDGLRATEHAIDAVAMGVRIQRRL